MKAKLAETQLPHPAARRGRWVTLSPVMREHLPFLYELAIDEESGFRWRYGGGVPPFEVFEKNLWTGVQIQFVIGDRATRNPIGFVQLYNVDHIQRFGYLGAILARQVQGVGIGMEGIVLFLRYVFATWDIRKLYLEMPEFNAHQLHSTIRLGIIEREGCFRRHSFYDGRWWDRHIYALYREVFQQWDGQCRTGLAPCITLTTEDLDIGIHKEGERKP